MMGNLFENMSFLSDFHFLRPHWLWAIIPLVMLVGLIRYIQKQQSGWQSVLAGHLYQHLITTDKANTARPPLLLLGVGWVLASLALAGPTWERLPQPVYQLNTGKVVLIDMSMSMRSTDVKPDRLTRAKYKAIDLVNAITEGETGLVVYAGDAFTISPLSSDAQNLTTLIPSLTPEIMPIAGSDPALGIKAAIELLSNAGYQQGEIFWITDGISNQQMKEVSNEINNSLFRVSVLAVGTEEGAPIKLTNGELLKDSRGAIVIPKLTSNNLKSLARSGGGRYAPMQANGTDIDYLIEQSLVSQDQDVDEQQEKENFGDKWQELGPYLLLILLPFAAYAFRKGIITVLFAACLIPVYTPQAQAGWWQDMWKTRDQQGMQAYKNSEFAQAAETFDDPLWQGNAHYRNQAYQAAIDAFSKVDSPQALYNTGNALAQLGELDQAIAAYEEVIKQQPDHQDAIANKALLEQLKQQQQQQQQQQQEEQEQSEGEQQEQDGQQNGDNQQGDQQDQQDQQGQDSQEQNNDEQQGDQQSENQQPSAPSEGQQEQDEENTESEEQRSADQQDAQQTSEESDSEQQPQAAQAQEQELTDEQKEQMQRMQNLLNRVPDDPAFLLKRKMQIESQQRKRERLPTNIQGNW
ncbi:VWA domain-containing protein [Paraglaciecola aquimarina]|uniref:VWA domain-containing protein n=1 Tax=Paraglaciecola aquimarina TaxID=1235557 RepID=A0ABU3SZS7_9ALTE|nr:VWA domain-containing protein [Paraglaciecola aquimarina]MDU0355519.1 VWA domain-containing protein [Paraglaciecola aquimarina]